MNKATLNKDIKGWKQAAPALQHKWNPGKKPMKLASINVRGLNDITKRQHITKWAEDNEVDILCMQETKINANTKENWGTYEAYFSTDIDAKTRDQAETKRHQGHKITRAEWQAIAEHHGVGIAINKKLIPHLLEIKAHSGRLIEAVFLNTTNVRIVSAYAPHAARPVEEKEHFYETLGELTNQHRHWHITIAGDFNAKLTGRKDIETAHIGRRILRGDRPRDLELLPDDTQQNRELFVQWCIAQDLTAGNTTFQKPDRKLVTYRSPGFEGWDTNTLGLEQVDFVCTRRRDHHTIQDIESDTEGAPFSDHFPIVAWIKIQTQKAQDKQPARTRFQWHSPYNNARNLTR